jgi:pimeloyl-ACP methyl ester carboxylesterase
MTLRVASNVGPSRIQVAWESFGPDEAPPVLLIMGVGAQMLGWHERFCAELVARGLRAIRFDNRDAVHNRRFTRLTNAFSKKLENHAASIAIQMMIYNFVRIHGSLHITPTMAAGITDHPREMARVVALLDVESIAAAA